MKTKTNIISRIAAITAAGTTLGFSAFAADPPASASDNPATPAAAKAPAKTDPATASSAATREHHKNRHPAQASHAWFGAIVETANTSTHHRGTDVKIVHTTTGSPAQKAGLKAGDAIWKFDGKRLTSTRQFRHELQSLKPGQVVPVEIFRHGKREELSVKLGSRIATAATASAAPVG